MRRRFLLFVLLIPVAWGAACAPKRPAVGTTRYPGGEISFRFDSSRLDRETEPALAGVLDFMTANASCVVVLEGRTDSAGGADYNLELGDRRARATKAWFLARGIGPERVVTVSYGEAGGKGLPARQRRRVVIRDGAR